MHSKYQFYALQASFGILPAGTVPEFPGYWAPLKTEVFRGLPLLF